MKIHIVQKGDTLPKIAQKYNVDYDSLRKINTHLSDPEKIVQGMKIKIPSESKPVKQGKQEVRKEKTKAKYPAEHPYKDVSPKPIPVIKEDDGEPKMAEKPEEMEKPMKPYEKPPKMPSFKEEFPQMPPFPMPEMEESMESYESDSQEIPFMAPPHYQVPMPDYSCYQPYMPHHTMPHVHHMKPMPKPAYQPWCQPMHPPHMGPYPYGGMEHGMYGGGYYPSQPQMEPDFDESSDFDMPGQWQGNQSWSPAPNTEFPPQQMAMPDYGAFAQQAPYGFMPSGYQQSGIQGYPGGYPGGYYGMPGPAAGGFSYQTPGYGPGDAGWQGGAPMPGAFGNVGGNMPGMYGMGYPQQMGSGNQPPFGQWRPSDDQNQDRDDE
ncbi:MAG: LysM peptidoglycan-binding domain-containing protein [Bacillaceae bacterium]|nr:LysM peptidoglycan-binding domain-containing protein [Bacillaceae bacterium]